MAGAPGTDYLGEGYPGQRLRQGLGDGGGHSHRGHGAGDDEGGDEGALVVLREHLGRSEHGVVPCHG